MSLLTCSLQLSAQSASRDRTGKLERLLDRNQLVFESVDDKDRTCHLPYLAHVVEPLLDECLTDVACNRLDDALDGRERTNEYQGAELDSRTNVDSRSAADRSACVRVEYLRRRCCDFDTAAC